MSTIKLLKTTLENFGPFVGKHEIEWPESGLLLLKGKVLETGDGSGSGKSYVLNSLPFVFGECPFPATELQSWFTDEPPSVTHHILTDKGKVKITRKKGLSVSGDMYKEPLKGKIAEAELDRIFGMDSKSRAVVTYRGQRQPGLFISLDDSSKKDFLSDLLELEKYDLLADKCKETADKLEKELEVQSAQYSNLLDSLQSTQKLLEEHSKTCKELGKPFENDPDLEKQAKALQEQIQILHQTALQAKSKYDPELEIINNEATNSIKFILSRQEPHEAATLRNSKDLITKDIQTIKEAWQAQKLELEKQKTKINNEINTLKIKYNDLKQQIDRKVQFEKVLRDSLEEEAKLNSNLCFTCKQTWVGTEAQAQLKLCKEKQETCKTELEHIKALETEIQEVGKQGRELKDSLAALQPTVIDPNYDILNKELSDIELKIKAILDAFENTKKQEVLAVESKKATDKKVITDKISSELLSINEKQKGLQNKLDALNKEIKTQNDLNFQRQRAWDVYNLTQGNVEHYTNKLNDCKVLLDSISQKLNVQRDLEALFGRKGFLGVIFEDVLNEISTVANDILGKVANVSHLTIEFRTEKENKKGSIATRITPVIYSRGREVSFKAGISGGMQVAVELAIDLAFGDVVSRRRGSYPGWLILDETFHGLGGVAKESCLEILNNYSQDRLVLVVDHDPPFQGLFNSIVEIEQQDGQSRVVG